MAIRHCQASEPTARLIADFTPFFSSEVDVLIIGAGPTGLGAAKRLNHIVSLAAARMAPPRAR